MIQQHLGFNTALSSYALSFALPNDRMSTKGHDSVRAFSSGYFFHMFAASADNVSSDVVVRPIPIPPFALPSGGGRPRRGGGQHIRISNARLIGAAYYSCTY